MKTIHEISIKSNVSEDYQAQISLVEVAGTIYYLITQTNNKGVINKFEERCETYNNGLKRFLEEVKEYARHTALMNL